MEKLQILFLCTGNSARSQMGEALLRKYAYERFDIFSAGLDPSIINPYTIQVLNEIGIDASNQYAKPLSKYAGKKDFDYLIIVCSDADKRCPVIPGVGKRIHWPFEDPAAFEGRDADKTTKFREVRDQIEEKITAWLKNFETKV